MTEPPYKRSRRDDDREAPRYDSRNQSDNHAPRAEADRKGDRNRSYRLRSPDRRDRYRAYGGTASSRARERDLGRDRQRDDPRDARGHDRRDDGRRHDDRGENRDRERRDDPRGPRDDARGHKRGREEDDSKARIRSRSPRRERSPQLPVKQENNGFDREPSAEQGLPMRERKTTRQSTPPPHLKFELNKSRGNSLERDSRRGSAISANDAHAASTHVKEELSSIKKKKPTAADFLGDAMDEDEQEDDIVVEEDPAMAAMQAMMGFGGFGTTKQKKVPGNDVGAVRKEKKTEYRQYMNRVGGFNRPLDEA